VFTVAAVDDFDCVGTEVYTLPVFTDPAISRVTRGHGRALPLGSPHLRERAVRLHAR
jgi:hypothetical protein